MNLLEYYYEDPYGNIVTGPLESSPLDYDGDGQPEQNIYSATKNSVQSVFSTLGQLVGTDDDVFIFVTDHGERENNISYITLWNNARLSPAEFNNELQKLHNSGGRINIMMGQCFSGGFIDSINQTNISITTSVSADEAAKARTDLQYSEYLYYWLSAMNGSKIDDGTPVEADTDDLVGVSFYEAYQSAKKADQKGDHPLYKSIPSSTGVICTLGYDQFVRPIIIGADKISSQHGASYSIQNLPDGANVTCLPGPGLVGPTSSIPANFRYGGRKIFEPSYISASISIGWITFQLHKIPVDCWGCGNYEASDYLTGGEGVYQISLPAGAYGFTWGCDSNWEPLYQGRFYVDFETKGDAPSMIWCDYTTPLGDAARAYRYE